MEIHAPHEPILTFREFMVHLLVVTVGILIALGLEQSVEVFHHHLLAAEARENMLSEIADNQKELQSALAKIPAMQKNRKDDLAVLAQLMEHKHLKDVSMSLSFSGPTINSASWTTASTVGALSFMDYGEVKRFAEIYKLQDLYDRLVSDQITGVQNGVGLMNGLQGGPEKLDDAELHSLKTELEKSQASLTVLEQVGKQLDAQYTKVLHK